MEKADEIQLEECRVDKFNENLLQTEKKKREELRAKYDMSDAVSVGSTSLALSDTQARRERKAKKKQ